MPHAASPAKVEKARANLGRLKQDYDARAAHWRASNIDPQVKRVLLEESDAQARRLFADADKLIIALQAGDRSGADTAYADMTKAYDAHREAVDRATPIIAADNAAVEANAQISPWRRYRLRTTASSRC